MARYNVEVLTEAESLDLLERLLGVMRDEHAIAAICKAFAPNSEARGELIEWLEDPEADLAPLTGDL